MGKRVIAGTGISVGAVFALPAVAQADDFTVTNLNDSGDGSLREALNDASTSGPDADRVLFKSKLSGTINLSGDPLYIAIGGDIEIIGPGARKVTIDAPPGEPAIVPWATLYGTPAFDVAISGLRVSGGNNTGAFFGDDGGGIQTVGEVDLSLSRVAIAGNSADGDGGGVAMVSAGAVSGALEIENSTISGNSAGADGGGVYFYGYGPELSILNSTISGNSADDEGGGAYLHGTDGSSGFVRNSTVTGNSANDGGGFYESFNGGTLRGTIVAGNTGTSDADLDGGPWATSFSLIGDTTGADIVSGGGNVLDVDPKLKPLKNNGGPTDTHAFKKSPAKNKGPGDAPNSDQRGAPRKGKPDIGAYELTKCEGVIVNRVGTAGKDKLKGTKKKDGILGLGGNDKLSGKKGKDGLCGGSGKDKLKGGPGKDKLDGGPGKDKEVQ